MDDERVSRAVAAATILAGAADLQVEEVVVLHSSNKLTLRLLPCNVVARVAPIGLEVLAFELEVARRLSAASGPVATPEPRVEPRVHEVDGFAMTLWTYERTACDPVAPAAYADALSRLHAAMRSVTVPAPHFTDRVARAEWLVTHREETPGLAEDDRELVLSTLSSAREAIQDREGAEQLLHGEPHERNVIGAQDGLRFIDLETCCRGPVEFDVAHVPEEVSASYRDVDHDLLGECRRLVLAMIAAWRWDVHDEFPQGHRHGRDILTLLRQGPPWPALGPLGDD